MNTGRTCVLLVALVAIASASTPWSQLGKIKTKNPSFVQLFPQAHGEADALWITSFSGNPLSNGKVHYALNIANQVAKSPDNVEVGLVNGDFLWPNLISYVPNGTIVGAPEVIAIVPDGFLVPGKGTGGLYAILREETSNGPVYNKNITLVEKKSGWFYHMVYWYDLNNDGRMDIISARAKSNLVDGSFEGELIWLEQPASNPLGGSWKEDVLARGPDVLFDIIDFDPKDRNIELYAAQFFSSKLKLYDIQTGSSPKVIYEELIYPLLSPYDIHLVDLNKDGRMDILCTEHLGPPTTPGGGNVTSFTIPIDFYKASEYKQRQLMSGYTVTEPGSNQMAPGFITLMHPKANSVEPYNMFIAGDGSQSAYYMTHKGEYKYDQELIVDVDGVVGIVASANIGPQGKAQFFIPNYDGNEVLIYSF